jgi:3-hydroxyisobutyrate dehydrogenase
MTLKVTVLGPGIMGAGMARSLARAGLDVTAWNRDKAKAEHLSDVVRVADTAVEAVRGADVVVTMLFDLHATESVMADALPHVTGVWVQSGTVGLQGALSLAEKAAEAGVAHVDAPVLGTRQPAENGQLTVLAAGTETEAVTAVFDAVGAKTLWVSQNPGDGHRLKLTANAWVVSITAAAAQSIELARAFDLDPSLFLELIEGGPLDSGYAQLKGKAMLADTYPPSFTLDGAVKDSALIAEAMGEAGKDNQVMRAINNIYAQASARGHGDKDMAAVDKGY